MPVSPVSISVHFSDHVKKGVCCFKPPERETKYLMINVSNVVDSLIREKLKVPAQQAKVDEMACIVLSGVWTQYLEETNQPFDLGEQVSPNDISSDDLGSGSDLESDRLVSRNNQASDEVSSQINLVPNESDSSPEVAPDELGSQSNLVPDALRSGQSDFTAKLQDVARKIINFSQPDERISTGFYNRLRGISKQVVSEFNNSK